MAPGDMLLNRLCDFCQREGLNGFDRRLLWHNCERLGYSLGQVEQALNSREGVLNLWKQVSSDVASQPPAAT